MRIRAVICLLLLLPAEILTAGTLLEEGESLILANKPREATVLLEQALRQEPRNERIYLYLGVLYEQMGETSRAIEVMRTGLDVAATARPLLCYNIANNLLAQGDYTGAEEMYGRAIALDANLADAYLNRANTRLRAARYPDALSDYVIYIRLDPASTQRAAIEQVIQLLNGLLAEEERTRQEEVARQKALMDHVLDTLRNASSDAKNVGVGSENVQVEFGSTGIED